MFIPTEFLSRPFAQGRCSYIITQCHTEEQRVAYIVIQQALLYAGQSRFNVSSKLPFGFGSEHLITPSVW